LLKNRDYEVNGIIITNCPERAKEYNAKGSPSMTEQEVYRIKHQIKGKMPNELKELICMVKTTIGGTVESICLKNRT